MQKYVGADCPYCHKPIKEGDEVSVCPQCGAPYHRACAKEAGGCVLTELHEKGGQWTRVQRPPASEIDGRASLRCSRCGSVNPPGSTVCEICGTPLDNATPEPEAEPWNRPNWQNPPAGNMGGGRFSGQGGAYVNGNPNPYDQNPYRQGGPGAPFQMPFDPFVNPMGGLDPEEELDGVKAKDAAAYVRQNTPYFLPKFKAFFRKTGGARGGFSWNWSAFIFDAYYLFYRKMYGLGAAVLAISVLLSVPSLIVYFENMLALMNGEGGLLAAIGLSAGRLQTLYSLANFLSLVMKLVLATMFNRAYAAHTVGAVKKQRAAIQDDNAYYSALARKGGVSLPGVLVAFGVTAVVSVISSTVFMGIIGMI